ncbi:MAG: spore coat U domain-containing protein, partial [Desulfobulbaceae bacterium]|nr:spore coat U domain-containing protein [Desulfobulbaceae bacterium]
MMKMKLAATILGLALISAGGTAFAALDNGPANYEITLTTGCTIDTTTASTNFGSYPVDNPALAGVAAGSVSVDCTTGTAYMLGMDAGMN